jgi:hypothetical protein
MKRNEVVLAAADVTAAAARPIVRIARNIYLVATGLPQHILDLWIDRPGRGC